MNNEVKQQKKAVRLYFPDDVVTVKILDLLKPFCPEERRLILAAVTANVDLWPLMAWRAGKDPHVVNMPEDGAAA